MSGRTIGDLVAQYQRMVVDRTTNEARKKNLQKYLSFFAQDICNLPIESLSRSALHECRERLLNSIISRKGNPLAKNATANRYFQTFFRMLSLAENTWGWEEAEGYPRLPKLKEPKPRTEFLSADQRVALLRACKESPNNHLYLLVVLAIATGCRKGELLKLRWSDINLKEGLTFLQDTKNGEPLRIKFSAYPLSLLTEYSTKRNPHSDLVFPSESDPEKPMDFKKSWTTARDKAGLSSKFVFHSLRHSFASDCASRGFTLHDIATLLNHKSTNTTKRYAHLTRDHTDRIVELINKDQFDAK